MRQRLFLTPYPKSLLIGELSAQLTERLLFESPCRLRDFHKRVRKCNLSGLSGHLPYQGRLADCDLRTAFPIILKGYTHLLFNAQIT